MGFNREIDQSQSGGMFVENVNVIPLAPQRGGMINVIIFRKEQCHLSRLLYVEPVLGSAARRGGVLQTAISNIMLNLITLGGKIRRAGGRMYDVSGLNGPKESLNYGHVLKQKTRTLPGFYDIC